MGTLATPPSSPAHVVFTKWRELTAAWSLWPSRGLLLSALVTHLTMWPTSECSCLPCDPRDATDSLTTLIMRSGRRIERDCLTGREVGWGERAQREIGHDPADWVRQKSTENYRGHREVNMRNNENTRQKTVYWTDGSFWSVCVLTDRCQRHTHMSHMYKQYVFHSVCKYFEFAADYVAWIYWKYDVSV